VTLPILFAGMKRAQRSTVEWCSHWSRGRQTCASQTYHQD